MLEQHKSECEGCGDILWDLEKVATSNKGRTLDTKEKSRRKTYIYSP